MSELLVSSVVSASVNIADITLPEVAVPEQPMHCPAQDPAHKPLHAPRQPLATASAVSIGTVDSLFTYSSASFTSAAGLTLFFSYNSLSSRKSLILRSGSYIF